MSRDSAQRKLLGSQADPEAGGDEAPRPEAAAARKATVRSLNRHADFNWLWLGQSVSSFGIQISMLAIPLSAVLYLHADAASPGVGVIGANIAETTLQLVVPRCLQGRMRAISAALIPFSMLWFIRSPLPWLRTIEPAALQNRREGIGRGHARWARGVAVYGAGLDRGQ